MRLPISPPIAAPATPAARCEARLPPNCEPMSAPVTAPIAVPVFSLAPWPVSGVAAQAARQAASGTAHTHLALDISPHPGVPLGGRTLPLVGGRITLGMGRKRDDDHRRRWFGPCLTEIGRHPLA